jgi:hypothetical protein
MLALLTLQRDILKSRIFNTLTG